MRLLAMTFAMHLTELPRADRAICSRVLCAHAGDKELDLKEMARFVKELAEAMMAVESGLDKPRKTKNNRPTVHCLSKTEEFLVAPM